MVIDSTDVNRLSIAKQELHQMMESDVSEGEEVTTRVTNTLYVAIAKRQSLGVCQ
jgi:hypothetical protein